MHELLFLHGVFHRRAMPLAVRPPPTHTRSSYRTVNNIQLHVKGRADFIVCSVKRYVDVPVRRVEAGRRLLLPVLVHTRPTTGRCSDSAHTESGDAPSVLACALT